MPMPALFIAHGAPTLALDTERGADFSAWGRTLLFAVGAAGDAAAEVSFPVTGFEYGSLSRRSVQFA